MIRVKKRSILKRKRLQIKQTILLQTIMRILKQIINNLLEIYLCTCVLYYGILLGNYSILTCLFLLLLLLTQVTFKLKPLGILIAFAFLLISIFAFRNYISYSSYHFDFELSYISALITFALNISVFILLVLKYVK